MKCPDCRKVLSDEATVCRCGWAKSGNAEVAFIPCAHEGCERPALCRIKLATGWARLCFAHYDAHFAEQGRQAMARYGLVRREGESQESFGRHVRQTWKDLAARSTVHWDDAA